jgi:hypothetical protein
MKKGVKEFVVDSERQKDILVDVKSTKKLITNFNKGRKSQFKAFKKLNAHRETSRDNFSDFFTLLEQERKQYYADLATARVGLAGKIMADEWQDIMKKSAEAVEQRQQKARKKAEKAKAKGKEKGYFAKTRKAINATVTDENSQQQLSHQLDVFNANLQKLQHALKSTNVKENDVLVRQDASREDIQQLHAEMSKLRQSGLNALVEFHMLVKENTDEAAWDKIMKQFNKEFSLTSV